jgi:hypothetical protein
VLAARGWRHPCSWPCWLGRPQRRCWRCEHSLPGLRPGGVAPRLLVSTGTHAVPQLQAGTSRCDPVCTPTPPKCLTSR